MLLLIDSNYIAHRAKFALTNLSFSLQKTGVIFGFFNSILALSSQFKTNNFAFCWDSRSIKRLEIFPDYKKLRYKNLTEDEIFLNKIAYEQFEITRKLLDEIGFINNFKIDGYESDDLIAKIVESYDDLIVISNDSDLYQLLNKCSMYDINRNKILDQKWLLDTYKVYPSEWITVKSLAGCASDCIPGIKGVGEKISVKFIRGELPEKSKAYKAIIAGDDIVKRNRELVTLPLKGTPVIELNDFNLNFDKFVDMCDYYGFVSFLYKDKLEKWKKFFNGYF
jgi:DNA polymerase-1